MFISFLIFGNEKKGCRAAEMRNKLKKTGEKLVRAAGILAVLMGIILAFAAFFVLQQSLIVEKPDYSADEVKEQLRAVRYVSAGAMYVIVFGIFNVIVGFFGAVNADNEDEAKKCLRYGIFAVVFCIVNGMIVAVMGDITKPLPMALIGFPMLIDGAYLIGSYFRVRSMTAAAELQSTGDSEGQDDEQKKTD